MTSKKKVYRRFFVVYASFFVCMLLMLVPIYQLSLNEVEQRTMKTTGAVLSSAALVAASALFSWFIGMSSRYSLVYGSLASVIILLVWLYLCGNILILGNVFNYVWYRRKQARYQREHPGA